MWQIVLIVVVVVAVAAGGFFGGRAAAGGTPTIDQAMKALQNATPEQLQQAFANGDGPRFLPGGGTGGNGVTGQRLQTGNAVAGEIVAADATSITVKTPEGSTKIVLISGSTPISKTTEGSIADLTAGQNVVVTGTTNSDGTVTANRVQVGEDLPVMQGRPQGTGTTGSTTAR